MEIIKSVIIYGAESCTNCKKAELLCQMKSLPVTSLYVGVDLSAQDLLEKVGKSVRTLPQIFVVDQAGNEVYVGGYEDLRRIV